MTLQSQADQDAELSAIDAYSKANPHLLWADATLVITNKIDIERPSGSGLIYSEASYFDGYHFAHITLWAERKRVDAFLTNSRKKVLGR